MTESLLSSARSRSLLREVTPYHTDAKCEYSTVIVNLRYSIIIVACFGGKRKQTTDGTEFGEVVHKVISRLSLDTSYEF